MRNFLKNTFLILPIPCRRLVVLLREWYWRNKMQQWEKSHYPEILNYTTTAEKNITKNILVYSVYGMTHGGTEKNLQLIANSLCKSNQVFFMYGQKKDSVPSYRQLDPKITLIPFSYTHNEVPVPHKLTGMNPHLKTVIREKNIDLIITASPGYSHYPWNTVLDIPIILINIFGAPTLQKNIIKVIYMSETTRKYAGRWIGKDARAEVMYAPLFKKPADNTEQLGHNLRKTFHISSSDFVFGRIGRDDDGIFDLIGIRAWQKIVHTYPEAHFLIMSPPPVLVKIVKAEKIPRVYFIDPSSKEEDVWAFHGAIDAMAHFRFDGETSGVAIAESLTVGNPVLSHRSRIWNAHLEYLNNNFSRVVDIDDVEAYANAMEEFIALKKEASQKWSTMKSAAATAGEQNFSSEKYQTFVTKLVNNL